MNTTLLFQIQSALIVLLMIVGIKNSKKRKLHVKIMLTSIIWDILLILQIELTRGAIEKVHGQLTIPMQRNPLLMVHLFFAIGSVVLYFFMMFSGRKILQGKTSCIKKHSLLGKVTFSFRVLTLLTSFFIHSS